MIMLDTFPKRLRYLIDLKNIIPADLVREKIGNAGQISKWLSGSTKTPSLKTLNRLSAYFNCDKGWLSDGTGSPPTKKELSETPENTSSITTSWQNELQKKKEAPAGKTEHPSLDEMLIMTMKVLKPGTVYRPALASNIEAFYQAVTGGCGDPAAESGQRPDHVLLIMTTTVLESATVYRTALVSNILAFYQAVQGEEEMSEMKEIMAAQGLQIETLTNMMATMQEKLDQALGISVPEKKDRAANS